MRPVVKALVRQDAEGAPSSRASHHNQYLSNSPQSADV
jgi:hypothetical protein